MRVSVGYAAQIVQVCAKLHNFIIDETNDTTVPGVWERDMRGFSPNDVQFVCLEDECDTDDARHRRRRDLEYSHMRTMFTNAIKDEGLCRPVIY